MEVFFKYLILQVLISWFLTRLCMVIYDQRAIIMTTVTTYNFYLIFVSKSGKSALSSIVIVNM